MSVLVAAWLLSAPPMINIIFDTASAARVLHAWPGPLAVAPHGQDILTGGRLVAEGPRDSPVRRAYEIYVKREDHLRPSWDQCAVYFAVMGPDALFGTRTGHRLHFDAASGNHKWVPDPGSKHVYVERLAAPDTIAAVVEELMCRRPPDADTTRMDGLHLQSPKARP